MEPEGEKAGKVVGVKVEGKVEQGKGKWRKEGSAKHSKLRRLRTGKHLV